MKKLLFVSLIFFSSLAFNAEKAGCIDGKIKYTAYKKEIIINERYCYDSLLKSITSVTKCGDQECLANKPGPFLLKRKEIFMPEGSPGFKICEKIGGVPQLIEFWDKESWIHTSRCIFSDGSYMDIGALSLKVKYVE